MKVYRDSYSISEIKNCCLLHHMPYYVIWRHQYKHNTWSALSSVILKHREPVCYCTDLVHGGLLVAGGCMAAHGAAGTPSATVALDAIWRFSSVACHHFLFFFAYHSYGISKKRKKNSVYRCCVTTPYEKESQYSHIHKVLIRASQTAHTALWKYVWLWMSVNEIFFFPLGKWPHLPIFHL